jgi:hypothetical protein
MVKQAAAFALPITSLLNPASDPPDVARTITEACNRQQGNAGFFGMLSAIFPKEVTAWALQRAR